MCKIQTTKAFQQLCEHIYLAKLISSCCFALSRAAANPNPFNMRLTKGHGVETILNNYTLWSYGNVCDLW